MKTKANRSSIIRIIISNYDHKGIKEIKVRYNKQAQLDTFLIDSYIENNKFKLNDITWKAKERYRYSIEIKKISENEVEIIKKDKFSDEKTIRKYRIQFEISDKSEYIVVAKIQDCLQHTPIKLDERKNIRRLYSQTERKLLSDKTQLSYSKIASCSPLEIDSLKIYKIKRYLSYRSNMLIFFSLINDFICESLYDEKGKKINEIWRITSNVDKSIIDKRVEIITKNLNETFTQEIVNYNNKIDKAIEKSNNSIKDCQNKILNNQKKLDNLNDSEENKLRKKIEEKIKKLQEDIERFKKIITLKEKEKLLSLDYNSIKSDVYKILEIYIELRHKLAHYNYVYFEKLFENKNLDSKLSNLLDLNIFKYTTLSKKLRIENKTNYLEDDTNFSILGISGSAKKYYSLYNTLCEQKNGFNTFINSFFVEDGIESIKFKKDVDKKFEKDIAFLKSRKEKNKKKFKFEKELVLLQKQYEELKTAYIWDIHNLSKYKNIYNERKEIIENYNKTLNGNKDKNALRKYGEELLTKKIEMEKLTKRNSIIRLKYKLQIAYSFIMIEFNGNISQFKNEFDISKIDQIKEYKSKGPKYLNYIDKTFDIKKFQNTIEKIENSHENNWLNNSTQNNLFKFYVLTYILLPFEFKGDFLGFVKKHYYDIKNVDFLDENNTELTNEQLEKMKNDSFFNKIRLFEKNTKKYNVFTKSILSEERIKRYFEILNIGVKYYEYMGTAGEKRGIFNKNIVIPIFKYYQIILKLYNDIEIATLLYLSNLKEISLENVIGILEKRQDTKNYTLNELFTFFKKIIKNEKEFDLGTKFKTNSKEISVVRNDILHLNYENFMENLLKADALDLSQNHKENFYLNIELRKLFNFIEENKNKLESVNLDFNFLNDYYMRKEQFIFSQLKQTDKVVTNTSEQKISQKDNELLKICKLNPEDKTLFDNTKNINKLYECSEVLRFISDDENIIKYEDIKENRVALNEIKYGKNRLSELKDINRIKEQIRKESSNILGLYKKQIINLIKKKILKKFKYEEEKILYLSSYDAASKKKHFHNIRIIRSLSENNFYFFNSNNALEKTILIGKTLKLKLTINNIDKEKNKNIVGNFYLHLSLNNKNNILSNNLIDLRQHYCFYEEIKFKD